MTGEVVVLMMKQATSILQYENLAFIILAGAACSAVSAILEGMPSRSRRRVAFIIVTSTQLGKGFVALRYGIRCRIATTTSHWCRRRLVERHPFLPAAVFKAFDRSKQIAVARLSDTSATKVTLPFVEEQLRAARAILGDDFWLYGLAPSRVVLDSFLERHHNEGLSARRLTSAGHAH